MFFEEAFYVSEQEEIQACSVISLSFPN